MWLHRFAVLTAISTFILIFVGGLVTSTGSGLSVPDWPLSFGQVFPPMKGGVAYEHGHRMVATFVGALTTVLAIWIYRSDRRTWMKWLGFMALIAVILQGIVGGITVLLKLPLAVSVVHASIAQVFFCLTVSLAVFTGPGWKNGSGRMGEWENGRKRFSSSTPPLSHSPILSFSLPRLCAITTVVIYIQIILGAVMRHMGAGLAIGDFPLAFGRIIPPIYHLDSAYVLVHFLHRMGAMVVTVCIVWTLWRIVNWHYKLKLGKIDMGNFGDSYEGLRLVRLALLLPVLLVVQIFLGAFIVWTQLSLFPTTAHVAVGASILATSLVLTLRSYQLIKLLAISF
jgi:cytochrome c oxidase assembly protein subunit 15